MQCKIKVRGKERKSFLDEENDRRWAKTRNQLHLTVAQCFELAPCVSAACSSVQHSIAKCRGLALFSIFRYCNCM
ncbi:hypothetical protein NIES2104_45920 [Leptolyngbya sp. NIES-2104]|nr:hypothetical protein NIES2104_45920 [Leptolyngbya sp. NIES-2104]